jgi:hypothetical protein
MRGPQSLPVAWRASGRSDSSPPTHSPARPHGSGVSVSSAPRSRFLRATSARMA